MPLKGPGLRCRQDRSGHRPAMEMERAPLLAEVA